MKLSYDLTKHVCIRALHHCVEKRIFFFDDVSHIYIEFKIMTMRGKTYIYVFVVLIVKWDTIGFCRPNVSKVYLQS